MDELRGINTSTCYMVSFEVESLFANVPLEETIDIISHKIYRENMIVTNITENDMKTLLFLCTSNSCFVLNDEYYMQVDGVAMGSPIDLL